MDKLVKVEDLKEGNQIDLYGDPYADPNKDPAKCLEFEYSTVEHVENDDGGVIVHTTEDGSYRFPVGHEVSTRQDEWLRAGTTVYSLMPIGRRRGEEQFRNKVTIQINVDREADGFDRAEDLAEKIRQLLQDHQVGL